MTDTTTTFSQLDWCNFVSHLGSAPFEPRALTVTYTQTPAPAVNARLTEVTRIRDAALRKYTRAMKREDNTIARVDHWRAWLIMREEKAARSGAPWDSAVKSTTNAMLDTLQQRLTLARVTVRMEYIDFMAAQAALDEITGKGD